MKILVIGQGIAGTLLSWQLRKKGATVRIADADLAGKSSTPAAGIINPVTGKRFVKSWRFDEFFPLAKQTYAQLEQELEVPLWQELPILRLLATPAEANDWALRCAQPDYAECLSETTDSGAWGKLLKPGFQFGLIHRAARVNFSSLLDAYRKHCQHHGMLTEKEFPFSDDAFRDYDRVVFCEGWRGQANPYFPDTPFRVSKGEALLIRFSNSTTDKASKTTIPSSLPSEMLKKTVLLVPMGEGTYWAGSTYRWHFPDTLPSKEGREFLLGHLREMLAAPFEVVGQVSGVRPTTIDRRPLILTSKKNPHVFMFNGLGTKGGLLGPYFAEYLAEEICKS